jgi:hypothetical protein
MVHDDRKLQSPWGRSPEQCVQGRWRAVATAFSGQPYEFLRSTVLAGNPMGIKGQSPLPNTALSALPVLSFAYWLLAISLYKTPDGWE